MVFRIPYVIPIPKASTLTENAKISKLKSIVSHLIYIIWKKGDFCEVNAKLYANLIPIQDIIERVTSNLDKDITYCRNIATSRYNTIAKDIKLSLIEQGGAKKKIIFHELDHMATSSKNNIKAANKGKPYPFLVTGLNMDMNINGGKPISFTSLNEGITEYKVMKYILYETASKQKVKNHKHLNDYLPYIKLVSQLIEKEQKNIEK